MTNFEVLRLIIFAAMLTVGIRTFPLIVKIPENNKFINKFFEALPYSVLTLLVFPGIFSSGGTKMIDFLKIFVGMMIVVVMSLKKKGLGLIITVSLVVILLFDILKYYLK